MSRATEILVAIIIGVIGSLLANFLQARLWATITTGLAGTAVYLLLAFLNERYPKLIGRKVCYASTGVVLRGDKILLIFHPRQKLWLPPGCHLKGTQYPHEAVLKAIERETGYKAEFHSLYDPVNQIDRFRTATTHGGPSFSL
jgi:hypothetical protein